MVLTLSWYIERQRGSTEGHLPCLRMALRGKTNAMKMLMMYSDNQERQSPWCHRRTRLGMDQNRQDGPGAKVVQRRTTPGSRPACRPWKHCKNFLLRQTKDVAHDYGHHQSMSGKGRTTLLVARHVIPATKMRMDRYGGRC